MRRPALLVIAGPNGSGKTTITTRLRRDHWSEGVEYLNPDDLAQPRVNAARVAGRVMLGGHTVPIEKIISRYTRSHANLEAALSIADRVYLFDNSVDDRDAVLCARVTNGKLRKLYVPAPPEWVQETVASLSTDAAFEHVREA